VTFLVARAFFRRGLQEALSYRVAFAMQLVGAAVSLAAFFYFARFVDSAAPALLGAYRGDYLSYGLVGLVILNLQHAAVSAYPQVVREAQLAGTLEAMLATPTPGWVVLLCAPIYRFASALAWAVALMLAGVLLFGVRLSAADIPALLVSVPLALVAFASLGFLGAAVTMLLRRPDPLSLVLGGVSVLAGGVFYPTQVLPGWLQQASVVLPITHALELVRRAAFLGAGLGELGPALVGLGIFCAVAAPVGLLAFSSALRRTRRDGSLSHY
jgi:ABC-2 type transport system permease protein